MTSPEAPESSWRSGRVALACLLVVTGAWSLLLHGATLLSPATRVPSAVFITGHAWCFDHIRRMLAGELPLSLTTDRVGFAGEIHAAFIGWAPAILVAPVGQFLGPVVAINVASLVEPLLAAVATWAWLRGRGISPTGAALGGLVLALSPPLTGALANGQLCKANVWALPLCLASLDLAARRPWAAPLSGLAFAACVFSEPTYGVIATLVAVVYGIDAVARSASRPWAALGVAVAGASWVPSLVLARAYYLVEGTQIFTPAGSVRGGHGDAVVSGSVSAPELVLGADYLADAENTAHVGYLGLVALGACVLAAARWRDARVAAALVALGATLALGEFAILDGELWETGGKVVALPARALAAAGFPFAQSGQYVRFLVVAWAAVALAVGAIATARPRWGAVAAALVCVDALRATAGLWPLGSFDVRGARDFPALAAVVPGGRVLDLPGLGGNFGNGLTQLRGALHGHAVDARARAGHRWANAPRPVSSVVFAIIEGQPELARRFLDSERIGLVTWVGPETPEGPSLEATVAALGSPETVGEVYYWRLTNNRLRPGPAR